MRCEMSDPATPTRKDISSSPRRAMISPRRGIRLLRLQSELRVRVADCAAVEPEQHVLQFALACDSQSLGGLGVQGSRSGGSGGQG